MNRLAYLSRAEARTLAAIAEVVVPGTGVPPDDVARNVDRYMASFRARRKWIVRAALIALEYYPLLSLRAPLSKLDPEARVTLIRERFERDVARRRILIGRELVRAIIRLGQQLAFLGCYGDPRSFQTTGYVPFSRRNRDVPTLPRRPLTPLPHDRTPDTLTADAVVVGSGAAGSILADRLVAAGRDVLMLERGRHVDRTQFVEDEIAQIATLYGDGALQLSRDFSFQVLQGSCVGGTTVVNNAVCFDLPPAVLERWNREHGAGLDPGRLAEAFRELRARLRIIPQNGSVLSPGAERFLAGAANLGLEPQIVDANVANCPGTGYCNIGCPVGHKLSMLETVLPDAQDKGLKILADATVDRIETDGHVTASLTYTHLAAAGALVPTTTEGRLRKALTGGPDLVYAPSRRDLEQLIRALKLIARIYLAAGAKRVLPNTYEFHELTDPDQLDVLDRYVKDATDLSVGTGHPQGGNALGAVVGPDFRLRGTDNVYVCDASVFPTAVGVNPQLTVMALARVAADGIAVTPAGNGAARAPSPRRTRRPRRPGAPPPATGSPSSRARR